MITRRSRYRATPLVVEADGTLLLDLRETPHIVSVLRIVPTTSDRLDLLAQLYYRDATRFWRICDASPELDPFDVLAAGEPLTIPPDE